MNVIRYLLDENVNPRLRTSLLQREPEMTVWQVGDPATPPKGTLDPAILDWCEANAFMLVTNNRKSMPIHLQDHLDKGHHSPGILELNPNMSFGQTVEILTLIWSASTMDEYLDRIIYLPL